MSNHETSTTRTMENTIEDRKRRHIGFWEGKGPSLILIPPGDEPHYDLFHTLAALPFVRAIDLGNPEMYALDDLLRWCAESGTVLYSRLPAMPGEDWRACLKRIGKAIRDSGARVVFRPQTYPAGREECSEMLELWREYTT
jgi:hypothetical protein